MIVWYTGTGQKPEYKTEGAAGADLVVESVRCVHDRRYPENLVEVKFGISVVIPEGFEGQLRLRSSAGKRGIVIPHGVGTIDSDYRGELSLFVYVPFDAEPIVVGDRIAQLVISPVVRAEFSLSPSLPTTTRGEGGFGSTGR